MSNDELARRRREEAAHELHKALDNKNHCDCDHHLDDHSFSEDVDPTPCQIKGCECKQWSEKGLRARLDTIIRDRERRAEARKATIVTILLVLLGLVAFAFKHTR